MQTYFWKEIANILGRKYIIYIFEQVLSILSLKICHGPMAVSHQRWVSLHKAIHLQHSSLST